MQVALIDIGSNSIRLGLYQLDAQFQVQSVRRYRYFVQLGKDMTAQGAINATNFRAGVAALEKLKWLLERELVDQTMVTATQALRQASNQEEFIDAVAQKTGLKIQVLTGKQEAYYDYCALQTPQVPATGAFLDTGGGSFEFGVLEGDKLLEVASWPFGAVQLFDQLQAPDPLSVDQQKTWCQRLQAKLRDLPRPQDQRLILLGGVHQVLFRILNAPNNQWLPTAQVQAQIQQIQRQTVDQNQSLLAIEKQRAPFMPTGLLPLQAVLQAFEIQEVCYCHVSLRDGLLAQYRQKMTASS
ncbi:hypothetical protein HU830_04085 [Lactobacillus sp. DCY120]|uniref:Ppx/GppA phosphatase N-terminal domain-containing protein n=1 Tax=Bombilactobacillus apium TaxID=2675299 RepID=A0A850R6T1_9LACO|nr:hypothetical protein [Bombilactobacillus apium]NVY96352.1 hypothetical protein [Bombilactobacillus apium]